MWARLTVCSRWIRTNPKGSKSGAGAGLVIRRVVAARLSNIERATERCTVIADAEPLGRNSTHLTCIARKARLDLTVHAGKAWAFCVRGTRGEGLSSAKSPVDASVPPCRDLLRRGQGLLGGAFRAAIRSLARIPRPGCHLAWVPHFALTQCCFFTHGCHVPQCCIVADRHEILPAMQQCGTHLFL